MFLSLERFLVLLTEIKSHVEMQYEEWVFAYHITNQDQMTIE